MLTRELCGRPMPAIGLGCMSLSQGYGTPPTVEEAGRVLEKAIDIGVVHFDSAALYGFGRNEELVGPFLKRHRDKVLLVSKGGLRGIDGKRVLDNDPKLLRKDIEASLRRLDTDVIDLYYLHRWDKRIPIAESIGLMSRFVEEGKVRWLGLSEVSSERIRKAHAEHPISAVQSEYSLWSRNVEISVLETCRQLGIAFIAFSPVARGFLTSVDLDPASFPEKDFRHGIPRFKPPYFEENRELLAAFRKLADDAGCMPAQLAIAWVLRQAEFIHAIPGTTSPAHLEENFAALEIELPDDVMQRAGELINQGTVAGPRYIPSTQAEIDTEEFI